MKNTLPLTLRHFICVAPFARRRRIGWQTWLRC